MSQIRIEGDGTIDVHGYVHAIRQLFDMLLAHQGIAIGSEIAGELQGELETVLNSAVYGDGGS